MDPALSAPTVATSDPHEKRFLDYCAAQELRFQQCSACGRFQHPPLPRCGGCGHSDPAWFETAGHGRLFTFTIVHHPSDERLADAVPYAVALIVLDDVPGVRLVSNIVDCELGELRIDMRLELAWRRAPNGRPLPCFAPRRT